jgi:hypothetical protein
VPPELHGLWCLRIGLVRQGRHGLPVGGASIRRYRDLGVIAPHDAIRLNLTSNADADDGRPGVSS